MKERTLSIFIAENGAITRISLDDLSLEEMQEHVGGLIEYAVVRNTEGFPVPASGLGHDEKGLKAGLCKVKDVIVNEEGLLRRMTPNAVSTFAAYAEGIQYERPLVGPAIIQVALPEDTSSLQWVDFDWIVERTIPEDMRHIAEELMKRKADEVGLDLETGDFLPSRYRIANYGEEE
ncbi:MAG: hypothetical protein Tp1100DCM51572_70 [Prokaryotic dsDNA virus sp.]|nr:MAG: hypothetical protein Tp1100DCM51572_70 [Prokaryotic dsDNA virus sp.]|tara:strand:- start:32609 stop:33139 length:531 start_codon:yes stop_codon:yes gene_type:complete